MRTVLATKTLTGPLSWKRVVVESFDGDDGYDVDPLLLHLGSECVLDMLEPLTGTVVTVRFAVSDAPLYLDTAPSRLETLTGLLTAKFVWGGDDGNSWYGSDTIDVGIETLNIKLGSGCHSIKGPTPEYVRGPDGKVVQRENIEMSFRQEGWAGHYGYLSVTGYWPANIATTPEYEGETLFTVGSPRPPCECQSCLLIG